MSHCYRLSRGSLGLLWVHRSGSSIAACQQSLCSHKGTSPLGEDFLWAKTNPGFHTGWQSSSIADKFHLPLKPKLDLRAEAVLNFECMVMSWPLGDGGRGRSSMDQIAQALQVLTLQIGNFLWLLAFLSEVTASPLSSIRGLDTVRQRYIK